MKIFRWMIILLAAISVLIAVIGPVYISPSILKYLNEKESIASLGTVGDYLGGSTTPFLTLASTLLVVVAILLQREELELQRNELIETRKEFVQQNQTLLRQRFENTFFHMITLHNEIISGLELVQTQRTHKGRNVFDRYYEIFRSYYEKEKKANPRYSDQQILQDAYLQFFNTHQSECGHYFRNLYRIYKFLEQNSDLTYEEKRDYAGIIRAQLSTYEIIMLLYNGLSPFGEKFLPLMKTYKVLDNINERLLLNNEHLKMTEIGEKRRC